MPNANPVFTLTCRCGAAVGSTLNPGRPDDVARLTGWKHVMAFPMVDGIWLCPACTARLSSLAHEALALINPPQGPWRQVPFQLIGGTPLAEFLPLADRQELSREYAANETSGFKRKDSSRRAG